MELGCTIPLQRYLGLSPPPEAAETDLRRCFDLHLLSPRGRPSLLLVHSASRFGALYVDPAARWGDLPALASDVVAHCLAEAGFEAAEAACIIKALGEPAVTKTHGRRPVAFLNRAVDDLHTLPVHIGAEVGLQPLITRALGDLPRRAAGHAGLGRASERFRLDMASVLSQSRL